MTLLCFILILTLLTDTLLQSNIALYHRVCVCVCAQSEAGGNYKGIVSQSSRSTCLKILTMKVR